MGKFSRDEDLKAPSVSSPESAHWLYTTSFKLHLRDRRTKTCLFVRSSVRLSFCPLCLSRASILWGNEPLCFTKI